MTDHPGRPEHLPENASANSSFRSSAQSARVTSQTSNRPASSDSASASANYRNDNSGTSRQPELRPQESSFSMSSRFARSRQDFNDWDDDASENGSERLEPAPVVMETFDNGDDNEDSDPPELDKQELRSLFLRMNESTDYYSILGLSKETSPSAAQIRAAYHRLSLLFHPDKHPQSMKAAAESFFMKLQLAYETLVEPRKRVIYDLQGPDGVQVEYRTGGAMQSGNPERQLGVKTMTPEQFRQYYIDILRAREREALENLVGVAGDAKITLNAHRLIDGTSKTMQIYNEDVGETIDLDIPRVLLKNVSISQSFEVPLSGLSRILTGKFDFSSILVDDCDEREEASSLMSSNVPKLTFSGSIGGELKTFTALPQSRPPEGPVSQQLPEAIRWQTLEETEHVAIRSKLEYRVPELGRNTNAGYIASMMAEMDVEVEAVALPRRQIVVGLSKSIPIFDTSRPFLGYMRTTFDHSLFYKPPSFDVRLQRQVGVRQSSYIQYGSGDFAWPRSLWSFLPVYKGPMWLPLGRSIPSVQLGWMLHPIREDVALDEEEIAMSTSKGSSASANELWHVTTGATDSNVTAQIIYGRDLFTTSLRIPPKSRFTASGDATHASTPRKLEISPRGIRLQLEGEIGLNSSVSGIIRGVRVVGDFTTISCGVGLNAHAGLFLSLSWRRLGQGITLPILLVPMEKLTSSAIAWAIAIPWATYAAIEFGIIRPLFNLRQRRWISRKRRELAALVTEKKEQAMEAVSLMAPLVEFKQAQEGESGLFIVRASYGAPVKPASSFSKSAFRPEEYADVTYAVASLVENGQLHIPRGLDKSQLVGFWDPAPLKKKILTVSYVFGGKMHYVEINGNAALRMPMREHEVDV